MIRKAFVMQVFPGSEHEYERRHNPIPAELVRVLYAAGVRNYSIFLHPTTGQLFGYAEIKSEERWQTIATMPECRHWWSYMEDVMAYEPNRTPSSTPLREVFHLD